MEERILKALAYVEDPDLGKDLVTLNMIQNLRHDGESVSFDLVLTTPACPMKDMLKKACITAINTMVDANLKVNVNVTSNVHSSRDNAEVLKGVKNVIAVASGKGGVGKSTIAMNLALALKRTGATVGLLDADIHGPSIPVISNSENTAPEMKDNMIFPVDIEGMKVMSIGYMIPRHQAVVWRGPMLSSALKQFSTDVEWGELDYLVIDLPPGTGDVHLSMLQLIPLNGILIVTTPDQLSIADAHKAINMYTNPQLKQEILGIVENMSYFQPEPGAPKYFLFGKGGGAQLAQESGQELIMQLPIVEKGNEFKLQAKYDQLAGKVAQSLVVNSVVS